MDGWLAIFRSNSILVISGRWASDNERLCAICAKISPQAWLEPGTARSVGQRLTHWVDPNFRIYSSAVFEENVGVLS